jgi:PAS domain S-box-containing protein
MASVVPPADRADGAWLCASAAFGYGMAAASVALALGLTLGLRYGTSNPTNFAFYIAIFGSTWFLGRGPGWFAATLALAAASVLLPYLMAGPSYHFAVTPADGADLAIVALCAATADVLSARRERGEAALRAATASRASEKRWRAVFETASVGIATSDAERRILSANAALQRMLGYSEAELQAMVWADLTHADDSPLTADWIPNLKAGRQQPYQLEQRCKHKNGKYRWCSVNASYVPAMEFSLEFFATIIVDIDDRKTAEEALQRAQSDLARVARITTMAELTASIAHEINQPLAAIAASGSACQRWLAGEPPNVSRARDSVSRIIAGANRAGEVIKRIRSFVSSKTSTQAALSINGVILEVLALLRGELQSKQVAVATHLDTGLPSITGDRLLLEQVILNLVMNAIEAMAAVTDRPRTLVVRSERFEGNTVRVTVEDSGVGLATENAARIFETFFTTKPEGMGMGLSISTSIIEAHGGRLWAEAAARHGAVLNFTLPMAGEQRP